MASHRHGRPGRLGGIAAVTLSATLLFPATEANAEPKPSAATTKKKLAKLNSQVDHLVNQYDKTKTGLDAAKKRLTTINREVAAEQEQQRALRVRVAQIAAAAYKNGTLDD